MEISEYIEVVGREGVRLLDAAGAAGLDAPVPSCSEWAVRDLVRHVGGVHHWATAQVAGRRTDEITGDLEDIVGGWPPDGELLGWAGEQRELLLAAFEAADPDFPYFTWFPTSTDTALTMWTRRQAHETAIHRVDADLAAGEVLPFDAAFAADGIDELLLDIVRERKKDVPVDKPLRLHLQATDVDRAWTVDVAPDGVSARSGAHGTAAGTAVAPASSLYLAVWHRLDALDVDGDPGALHAWWAAVAPAWS